jgi:hypothetical protein
VTWCYVAITPDQRRQAVNQLATMILDYHQAQHHATGQRG